MKNRQAQPFDILLLITIGFAVIGYVLVKAV